MYLEVHGSMVLVVQGNHSKLDNLSCGALNWCIHRFSLGILDGFPMLREHTIKPPNPTKIVDYFLLTMCNLNLSVDILLNLRKGSEVICLKFPSLVNRNVELLANLEWG